ncbi:unnamed protein product, partial [Gulo gulo]
RNRSTKVIKPGGPYVGLYRYRFPSQIDWNNSRPL